MNLEYVKKLNLHVLTILLNLQILLSITQIKPNVLIKHVLINQKELIILILYVKHGYLFVQVRWMVLAVWI